MVIRRPLRTRASGQRSGTGGPPWDPAIEPLIRSHRAAHPRADMALLARAYLVAEREHRGQMRQSGLPFITHPLEVTMLVAALGMDTTTLVASLLHDTVEDTGYTLDLARAEFGDEVALLVDGVTKLDKLTFGAAAEAETIRKMLVAMGRDPRVLVIKLADRVHNMRTLGAKSRPSQVRIARATLEVLAPLADRLGIQVFRRELEDLALAILHPPEYEQLVRLTARRVPQRQRYLATVIEPLEADLRAARVRATVRDHPRHAFSVYETIIQRGGSITDVYDNARVLIVIDGDASGCYTTLGMVHARWTPVSGRFKDFIALPKFNFYQSLHTSIVGPLDQLIDVQIRTEAMQRTAEYGIAANPAAVAERADDLRWLTRLLDWQRFASDPAEFLEALSFDLVEEEVLVFLPDGEALSLPTDATPVDAAYALSTEIGNRCVGARVNGRLVPLSRPLQDGDVVEVLTSTVRHHGPSREWLRFVKSPKAHVAIRQWMADTGQFPAIGSDTDADDGPGSEGDTQIEEVGSDAGA